MKAETRRKLSEWLVTLPSFVWLLVLFLIPTVLVFAITFKPATPYGGIGAGWWITLWKVLVPMLAPGILAGGLLAFTLSIDDFVISFFVAGPGSTTLPIKIYSMIKYGAPPLINALSTILLAVTFLCVIASQYLSGKEHKAAA